MASLPVHSHHRSRTPQQNAVALRHVAAYASLGLSLDVSIKTAAAAECTSPHTLRVALEQFHTTSTLPIPSTSHRGRGNPDHPLHSSNTEQYGPSFEAEKLMHKLVHAQQTDGVCVTATTIAAELRTRLNITVTRRTVRRWLRALGYRWRCKRYVGGMKPQAKAARIRQFILEYAAALGEEAADRAIIVYIDESFIHAHLARKKGWFHVSCRDVIGDGNGKRLIILHAMTDRGLLAVPDTNRLQLAKRASSHRRARVRGGARGWTGRQRLSQYHDGRQVRRLAAQSSAAHVQ